MSQLVHADFNAAFVEGHVFRSRHGDIRVRTVPVASLLLVSGEILAWDPAWLISELDCKLQYCKPFARRLPPGRYPISLSMARCDNGGEPVACSRIQFRPSQPVRWELATRPGEDISQLEPLALYGYGVDSGQGCFADCQAIARLGRNELLRINAEEELMRVMGKRDPPATWGEIVLDAMTGANLVAFRSGWGDGFYASWWGMDAQGEPVALVTDFGLLIENIEAEIPFERVPERFGTILEHPDLQVAGLKVRIGRVDSRRTEITIQGAAKSGCEFVLLNGSERIDSLRLGCTYRGHTKSFTFPTERELGNEARLVLKFVKGIRAL